MRNLNKKEVEQLTQSNNIGALDRIEVMNDFDISTCEISGNIFKSKNVLSDNNQIINSILKGTILDRNTFVIKSTVVKSVIGRGTIVKNNSVVKDSVCSPIVVPVLQDDGSTEDRLFYVLINNSHVDGDAIFGGSDLRKTKSRGGSVFIFAHLGEGEFTKNVVIGTQPNAENKKTLVNIAHFGYYGKMIVMALAVYDENGDIPDINKEQFYSKNLQALKQLFFGKTTNVDFETGRVNIGSGGSMSDYDPIKDTKSGAVILLANTGVDVTIPPYLTMLPHSLLASSSVDSTKHLSGGILGHGDLGSTTREKSINLPGYYVKNERKVLNDRCHEEMKFVMRYMRLIRVFARVAAEGNLQKTGIEKLAWKKAYGVLGKIAHSVNKRWLKSYLETLEEYSIPGLKKRITKENLSRLEQKLEVQQRLLRRKDELLETGDELLNSMKEGLIEPSLQEILGKGARELKVTSVSEQKHQLSVSIVEMPDKLGTM